MKVFTCFLWFGHQECWDSAIDEWDQCTPPFTRIPDDAEIKKGMVIKSRYYQGVGKIFLVKAFDELPREEFLPDQLFEVWAEELIPVLALAQDISLLIIPKE